MTAQGRRLPVTVISSNDGSVCCAAPLPASKIDLVQKYVGGSKTEPELSKFGGTSWANKKARVEQAVMDLASARDVKLVPVDDKTMAEMKKSNPGYNKLIIKAGTYPKQDKDVPVIGYSTHLVVACDLPENTVYQMVKTMAGNVDSMAAVVKSIEGIKPKDMALDIGVPFHKGAAKFYKEAGAM